MLSRHGGVLHQNVSFFPIDCILIKRKAIDCCQYQIFIKSSKTFIFLLLCQSKHNVSVEYWGYLDFITPENALRRHACRAQSCPMQEGHTVCRSLPKTM